MSGMSGNRDMTIKTQVVMKHKSDKVRCRRSVHLSDGEHKATIKLRDDELLSNIAHLTAKDYNALAQYIKLLGT